MNDETAARLIALNADFYGSLAAPFDRSRQVDPPGFLRTLVYLPDQPLTVLDVGCGNGRYGRFLAEHGRLASYTGIDLAPELIDKGAELLADITPPPAFLIRDMADPAVLDDLGQFDLIVCLSALQHLPQRRRRVHLLRQMGQHLTSDGRILLGNWQFLDSERQRRKIRPWSEVGLSDHEVEAHDYLLTWQRGGFSYRYVALIDRKETASLAAEGGCRVVDQFRADGRENDLNLYTLLSADLAERGSNR